MKNYLQPMLVNDEQCPTAKVFLQPKLDGIRATWDAENKTLFTKTGTEITAVPYLVEALSKCNLANLELDGELYSHGMDLGDIYSLTMRKEYTPGSPRLEFHVFDCVDEYLNQTERLETISGLQENQCLKLVPTTQVNTWPEIESLYLGFLNLGYEGIILRKKFAFYTPGKMHKVFKIKPVLDLEAELVDFVPAAACSRNRDTFGSIKLRLPDGKTFKCSGFSDDQRQELWHTRPVGESITVEYSTLSARGIPLQPRFKAIRKDLISHAGQMEGRL